VRVLLVVSERDDSADGLPDVAINGGFGIRGIVIRAVDAAAGEPAASTSNDLGNAPMRPTTVVTVLLVVVLVIVWVRLISLMLNDLGQTRDEDLRVLTRKGWIVAIVAMFPIGAILYLRIGKGPRRYL
jgi:hypothetical protein